MRLWHESLIPYLPRQQLLGQHRECCALRGKGWGKPHSTVNYVFDHPIEWLWAYHMKVMQEMSRRGYKHDDKWEFVRYRGKKSNMCEAKDNSEIRDAVCKLSKNVIVYPEHNTLYLGECLHNLYEKGVEIKFEK